MLSYYFLLTCLIQSLFAVDLSIYKSFTEVRQAQNGIGNIKYSFTINDFSNVIDGSISWDGTPVVRQEVYNTIQSLQDARVTVRSSSKCGDCETIQAKIVDPETMLLQNLKTGAYFYADKQAIEYTSVRPTESETTLALEFQTELTPHTGVLSYLVKGITWTPSYDLFLTGNNDYKLRAYANIKNNQEKEYTVETTQLLGGNVQLANGVGIPDREMDLAVRPSMRPIQSAGELSGLYSYVLSDKYTLRPSSSIRLPFVTIAAKYQFYYKTVTSINTGVYQGVFERNYDITPDHFMPAGVITVRDNKVLVGQAVLPDVPENYTQTFSVGQDNDIRYLVKGNMVSKSDDKAPKSWETYEVNVEVKNFKTKTINAQLVFQRGVQITLRDTTCKSMSVQGNQLQFPVQLEASGSSQCKFIVTVNLN